MQEGLKQGETSGQVAATCLQMSRVYVSKVPNPDGGRKRGKDSLSSVCEFGKGKGVDIADILVHYRIFL